MKYKKQEEVKQLMFSLPQTAQMLGKSNATISRYAKQWILPHYKGLEYQWKHWTYYMKEFHIDDINAFLKSKKVW